MGILLGAFGFGRPGLELGSAVVGTDGIEGCRGHLDAGALLDKLGDIVLIEGRVKIFILGDTAAEA
jgi:hypothetical protein